MASGVAQPEQQGVTPNFQVFRKRMSAALKKPAVTIQKAGGISFNAAAYEALGRPEAIELLFDPETRIMGARPVAPSETHSYPVRPPSTKRDPGFIISGKAFTAFYDIPTDVARRRLAYLQDGILCVDLNEPGVEVTSNRNGR
jgi:hypothetical protein